MKNIKYILLKIVKTPHDTITIKLSKSILDFIFDSLGFNTTGFAELNFKLRTEFKL